MAQYIDKEKLATKLSVYISNYKKMLAKMDRPNIRWADSMAILEGKIDVLQHLLTICDNLEVKEMDIEESARHYLLNEHKSPLNEVFHQADLNAEMQYHKDIEHAFKAGFELGLKSKGE